MMLSSATQKLTNTLLSRRTDNQKEKEEEHRQLERQGINGTTIPNVVVDMKDENDKNQNQNDKNNSNNHHEDEKKDDNDHVDGSVSKSSSSMNKNATTTNSSSSHATFTTASQPLSEEFELLDRYWKASNYLAVGQIYLMDSNPLLRNKNIDDDDKNNDKDPVLLLDPTRDIKRRLLGHFGTVPGQNFMYTHLNRLIVKQQQEQEQEQQEQHNWIYLSGPGHGGPGVVAQTYLEGTYSEVYPDISQDEEGMGKLFHQFSFPGGIPSHVAPETPGSMHEGGELGYSLSHSFGIVLDQPNTIVACVVGDGEAETGPLATSWHGNKFINPKTDGAVLPILHLNGFKIANPALLARIPQETELIPLFRGYGYNPIVVEGEDPSHMHPAFAKALEDAYDQIRSIQHNARRQESQDQDQLLERPTWPMIIFKSPKGWTGPQIVDGSMIENSYRAHQVPLSNPRENKEHCQILQDWLLSYQPHRQFDDNGRLVPELQELAPKGKARMSANPLTNPTVQPLKLPSFLKYGVDVNPKERGIVQASDTFTFGTYLRDVLKELPQENKGSSSKFRMFSPDETKSNKLHAIFEDGIATKQFMGRIDQDHDDAIVSQEGRIMEILSEHQCEGMLEGYLLAGGHGLLNSYEAFIHIISSMVNQHAKWLEASSRVSWRKPLASLNILLSSHVWRQDHNGFTHQDPGFLQHVSTKKPEIVRIYLPPDANCLLSVMNHCLESKHYINVTVAGKHQSPQWLTPQEAADHCSAGVGVWDWASCDTSDNIGHNPKDPDIVLACAGDIPTQETIATAMILRQMLPKLKVRVVNVVNIMKLHTPSRHPHGLSNDAYDRIFTRDKPVLFNFHAYPQMIYHLIFGRFNQNFVVRGYQEEGTITTPFDMCVLNGIDRWHLVMDVCDILTGQAMDGITSNVTLPTHLSENEEEKKLFSETHQTMDESLSRHKEYIYQEGVDLPEISEWKWTLSNNN